MNLRVFILLIYIVSTGEVIGQAWNRSQLLENESIKGEVSIRGMRMLVSPKDTFQANVVGSSRWGRANVTYRVPGGEWLSINTYNTTFETAEEGKARIIDNQPGMPLVMEETFTLNEKGIDLDINVRAAMQFPIEIGDLSISFPWQSPSGGSQESIFEKGYTKHQFISGYGSFIYFTRPSGKGPYLMILPKAGTKFEYYENEGQFEVFIHSKVSGVDEGGTWRQEHTSIHLNSEEKPKEVTYGVRFWWADSWQEMRDIIYEEGLFDIRVVPGMTVPSDLSAMFSLHTKQDIASVEAEFAEQTVIEYLGEKMPDHHVYKVKFNKLGENMLTVRYGDGYKTYLEFFSTEPLETLIKKRSDFIVNQQQHMDTAKWYNGLYSVWDMRTAELRGPDNTDGYEGWWGYVLASDDPALCKAPYVAAKNVFFPNKKEIESVEYYLENYVWGGLQRTDMDDPYPYGIYGVPNWKVARDPLARAGTRSRQLDRMQVWRTYDYPHMVMLYYHMYEIARANPELVSYLDADGYLERAWQTAKAYFIYPYEIFGEYYETYKHGCYNELVIENLIEDLEFEGRQEEADWLRNEYEKKVKYFIYDDDYPYGSEYSFDRTAFESSYAFAKYGYLHEMKPDTNLWYDQNAEKWMSHPEVSKAAARDFMEQQHLANLAVRGWLEAKYFLLGADFTRSSDRNTLSYMAKMGGWSILDYGINFAESPDDWLQLGYASYLSSWALMNTGTEDSNYGYWYPGKANDGAMGWAFTTAKNARVWIRKETERGAWMYDGEADLGNGAAIRIASTILTNDPLFGWISYGGDLKTSKKRFEVVPKDGIRSRFAVVTDQVRLHLKLETDGFKENEVIQISSDLKKITGVLENRMGNTHTTRLWIENYNQQEMVLEVDGQVVPLKKDPDEAGIYFANLYISEPDHSITLTIK